MILLDAGGGGGGLLPPTSLLQAGEAGCRMGSLSQSMLGYPGGPEHVWPARAAGALRLLSARGRVCTFILTVCCSRGCGVLARGARARPRWARL